ncbi:MAG: hypothetical protein ACU0CO_15715, partial [Shimia sp.]
ALHYAGQALGRPEPLAQTVTMMAWVQLLFLGGQVVQAALFLISPVFAALAGFAIILILLWVFLCFIDETYGLGSLGRAAFCLLIAVVGVGLGLTLILGLIGVGV